jgi:HEAT repeat protein
MEEENFEEKIDFNEVIDALLDSSNTFPAKFLSRLSDLEDMELEQLTETWPKCTLLRRERLLEDLEQLADSSYIVNFDQVFKLGLEDENPQVRLIAIRGLWENDDLSTAITLMKILNTDPDPDVCAQAVNGLGKFVFLGELEELDKGLAKQITQILIDVCNSEEPEIIRRRAIEALGFSSHPQAAALIETAYNKKKENWLVSALIAMGRSANNQWVPQIIENLSHEDGEIRLEAAQSAGLLGAQETTSHLLQMIDDPEEDVKLAAIWALSEIGGMDARAALEGLLKNSRDENEIEFLEEALENLDFNEVNLGFEIFDLSEENLEEMIDEDKDEDDWVEDY